jgi:hypothetical protein
MTTVLECILPKSTVLLRVFCGQKNSMQRIRKEVFPVYGGKCLFRKVVHNRVKKFSQGRSKIIDDARPDAEVDETTVKRLLCCTIRRIGKAMKQVYQCRRRIC